MNAEIGKRNFKLPPKKVTIISLITFILLMIAITVQLSYSVLSYDNIYKGVYIGDFYAGSISSDELRDTLQKGYQDKADSLVLTITSKGFSENLAFADMDVKYDIEKAIEQAYDVGRTGNVFSRLIDIYKSSKHGIHLDLSVTYQKSKIEDAVNSLYSDTLVDVKEADLLIEDDQVTIRSGHAGESIDKEKTINAIIESVKSCEGNIIKVPIHKTKPSEVNIEEYYNQINREVRDASIIVEDNKAVIIPDVIGRSIDKPALIAIADELQNTEDTEKILPVIFLQPKIRVSDVSKNLFKDTLGSMSTKFDTSTTNNANRGTNIKIATSKINGKILAAGEVFSYNDVVGPRTQAGGYKEAHAYISGGIVDSIGGGICQVSTTLYNAALFSDLGIVKRSNHTFTVGYVPLGRDAAVSYDQVDLKFKNTTNWPIKIEGWVSADNRVHFTIKGTNETPSKVVEINSKTIKTINYSTKYIDDPTLLVGTNVVKTSGMNGYNVDTYKIVKINGKVISEEKFNSSYYKPLNREIRRGTKQPAATAEPSPLIQTIKGVDDAANPPAELELLAPPETPAV